MAEKKENENKEEKTDIPRRKRGAANSAWEWAKSIAVAFVVWIFLRSLLIEAFRIPSGSMENTLLVGDFLFVNKALYGAELPIIGTRFPAIREPVTGDIVVFDSVEEENVNVVKRIVGSPADTIDMRDNVLYRNGVRVDEPWVIITSAGSDTASARMRSWQVRYLAGVDPRTYRPTQRNWGPIVVPRDSFFVMGDNRDNSYDSRYWGFLARDRIKGRPLFVYYSFDKTGVLPLPAITGIRWGRLFSSPQ